MKTIIQPSLSNLVSIQEKIKDIKRELTSNQKLVITLDTETTGKYYNKFQIENTSVDIVDKIIEFGAIFSIENIDSKGFKTIEPILIDGVDYGFRAFFNPFIDGHKPFHLKMPDEPFNIHGVSLDFLEGNGKIDISNERLEFEAPSILKNYEMGEITTSYIKEIIYIINSCNILVAHNAIFDLGMINEAINDYNKIEGNEKLPYCSCEVLDTLAFFKDVFPKEKLIAMQEENNPTEINHKLDYLMYLAGIESRDVHGAYWDSKLLIDSYSKLLNKYLRIDFMNNIVEKQTKYLSQLEYVYNNNKINDFKKIKENLFFEKLHDINFLDYNKVKEHLTLQLGNINKQKRNIITEDQIDNSILYYKAFLELNKDIDSIIKLDEKVNKMTSRTYVRMLKDLKDSKVFSSEELMNLDEIDMSHYLTQAVYHYFKYQFEKLIAIPLLEEEFELLNTIIENEKDFKIEIEKDLIYSYFRTDGSIATKDNSLTTVIGSVSNVNKYLESCNTNKVICMDFNSMVNYINVSKVVKSYNENTEDKIDLSYGLTTLLKINLDENLQDKYNISKEFIEIEINIICKNESGIRLLPQILKQCYSDKTKEEDSYKDPYLNIEQFNKLNKNDNLFVTLGSYKGLIERVVFDLNIENKKDFIVDIIKLFEDKINIEVYPSDVFLYKYKEQFQELVEYVFTDPRIYLDGDYEYHVIRNHKYNDVVYQLNSLDIFENFKVIN